MTYYDITLPKSKFRYWCDPAQKMGDIWVFAIHVEMPMRNPVCFLRDSSVGLMEKQEFIDICEEWVEKTLYKNAGVSKYDLEKVDGLWSTEWDKKMLEKWTGGAPPVPQQPTTQFYPATEEEIARMQQGYTTTNEDGVIGVVRTSARPASERTLRTTMYRTPDGAEIEFVHWPLFDGPVPPEVPTPTVSLAGATFDVAPEAVQNNRYHDPATGLTIQVNPPVVITPGAWHTQADHDAIRNSRPSMEQIYRDYMNMGVIPIIPTED